MAPEILLVNPPVYDFAAYDFWLKPYGMLSVAGKLRNRARFKLFDFMDRLHPFADKQHLRTDRWNRGRFYYETIPRPQPLESIPRYFRRFGLPRKIFQDFLKQERPFDFVFIQTAMTYWYPGVREVIEDVRKITPGAKIILGGNYVTLCLKHAECLNSDFIVHGTNLEPLWKYLRINPEPDQPPLWQLYDKLNVGVLKLTDGCPFQCTYCSVPEVYGKFKTRPLQHSLAQLEMLSSLAVKDIAFYDDALLFDAHKVLVPFLNEVINRNIKVNFHTPNALNARFITEDLAELMVKAGFRTFYLGFESASQKWQKRTGSKVFSDELAMAVEYLNVARASCPCARPKRPCREITAYQILGHPHIEIQQLENSMHFVNSLGIRGMLADFSPIPGTPDGDYCKKWVDMNEPLMHNKTAFPIILMGFDESNRLKDLQRKLNRSLGKTHRQNR
jgi:hypothetical protein